MSVDRYEKSGNKVNDKKEMNEIYKPYKKDVCVHTLATFVITQIPGGRVPAGRHQSRIVTTIGGRGAVIPFTCGPIVFGGQQRCQDFFKS
jgi:hypothetical protein